MHFCVFFVRCILQCHVILTLHFARCLLHDSCILHRAFCTPPRIQSCILHAPRIVHFARLPRASRGSRLASRRALLCGPWCHWPGYQLAAPPAWPMVPPPNQGAPLRKRPYSTGRPWSRVRLWAHVCMSYIALRALVAQRRPWRVLNDRASCIASASCVALCMSAGHRAPCMTTGRTRRGNQTESFWPVYALTARPMVHGVDLASAARWRAAHGTAWQPGSTSE